MGQGSYRRWDSADTHRRKEPGRDGPPSLTLGRTHEYFNPLRPLLPTSGVQMPRIPSCTTNTATAARRARDCRVAPQDARLQVGWLPIQYLCQRRRAPHAKVTCRRAASVLLTGEMNEEGWVPPFPNTTGKYFLPDYETSLPQIRFLAHALPIISQSQIFSLSHFAAAVLRVPLLKWMERYRELAVIRDAGKEGQRGGMRG